MANKAKNTAQKVTDTQIVPNAQFPFGIKVVDAKGNTSWERFKTAKERDTRAASVKGSKRVDFAIDTPAAAKPEAKAKPAKPEAKAEAKPEALAIHVNKTGRLCFGKSAAARLGDSPFCTLAVEKGIVRIEPIKKEIEGALTIRDGGGRPYISATKQFKPLGFDGSRPYDIEAKPYGTAGFEFRLQ